MKNLHKNIGVFATSLLAASSAVYIYSPVIGSHADSSATADINLSVGEVMNLTLDTNSLNLSTSLNSFVSGVINATASTNSQYGYTLTLEDVDSNTNLVHTNENIDAVVSSNFSGSKTSSEMEANTWGFSLDATNFSKIPANGSAATIKTTNTPMATASETTPVTFGAKVGILTSGTYTDKVLFTMYVNGQDDGGDNDCNDLFCLSEMQDITPRICNETTTPLASATRFDWDGSHAGDKSYVPRVKLIDNRDGNEYLVSKLADGNCWMSQSLALELTENTAIEISNNDGTTGIATPDFTTQITTNSNYDAWPAHENTWRSYHPKSSESYYRSGLTKSYSASATGDEYNWEKAGNYYNWYAATAGTGTVEMAGGEATSSICPKGWRLPTDEGEKSFDNLFTTAYGINSDSAGALKVRSAPLNFNLSGVYNYGDITNPVGLFNSSSMRMGSYWTSTDYPDDEESADRLLINESYVWPHAMADKGYGFSIRCVAI